MLQNNARDKNDSSSHLYIMDWEQAVARNVQDSYIFLKSLKRKWLYFIKKNSNNNCNNYNNNYNDRSNSRW